MTSHWESRERKVRRFALVLSVILHLAAVVMISTSFGSNGIQQLFKGLFGSDQTEHVDEPIV